MRSPPDQLCGAFNQTTGLQKKAGRAELPRVFPAWFGTSCQEWFISKSVKFAFGLRDVGFHNVTVETVDRTGRKWSTYPSRFSKKQCNTQSVLFIHCWHSTRLILGVMNTSCPHVAAFNSQGSNQLYKSH